MHHVQIAVILKPGFVRLDAQGSNQPQAGGDVWKDAHDAGASLDLLIEPFEHVAALHVFVVRARHPIEVQRLTDVVLRPVDE